MAISPPSDIVLDVARAADPAEIEAARARLRALVDAAQGGEGFAATARAGMRGAPVAAGPRSETPEAFRKFEAMVLQTFVQGMLPDGAENVYGAGLAGEMWKSFLAKEMAGAMAERGGIGIADRVLSDYYMVDDQRVPVSGVHGDKVAREAADLQSLLATALVDEHQRRFARWIDEDAAPATGVTAER